MHRGRRLPLIERLKQRQLRHRIPFRRAQRAPMGLLPLLELGVADEYRNCKDDLAIARHVKHVLYAIETLALRRPLAFVEVLVDVAALGGMGFLPPNRRGASERSLLLPEPIEHFK